MVGRLSSSSAVLNTVPSTHVISFASMPELSASAISTMDVSPMPYMRRSAWESSKMERFMVSDQ